MVGLSSLASVMAEQNHLVFFYPVHLTLFTTISMKTRIMRDVFIRIGMNCTLDLVTVGNLKRLFQLDNPLRSQVAQATAQTLAEQKFSSTAIMGRKLNQELLEKRNFNPNSVFLCHFKLVPEMFLNVCQES